MKMKIAALLLALATLLPGCAKETPTPLPVESPARVATFAEGRELLCLAESEDQAREIAELYGIELVEYKNGLAVFHTEEDPMTVKERGIKNGWPELEGNIINELK